MSTEARGVLTTFLPEAAGGSLRRAPGFPGNRYAPFCGAKGLRLYRRKGSPLAKPDEAESRRGSEHPRRSVFFHQNHLTAAPRLYIIASLWRCNSVGQSSRFIPDLSLVRIQSPLPSKKAREIGLFFVSWARFESLVFALVWGFDYILTTCNPKSILSSPPIFILLRMHVKTPVWGFLRESLITLMLFVM